MSYLMADKAPIGFSVDRSMGSMDTIATNSRA